MLILCGLFIAFEAAAGFLFGQLFAGHFSLAATLAGGAGVACSVGAFLLAAKPGGSVPWVQWASLVALFGVALDIVDYYMYLDNPYNYYPWFLVAPFALCVAWVGYTARKRIRARAAA